jgi:hypothetical protein
MAGWPRQQVILARAFRNVSEHFEAFRNKPLPLVAFCCGLTGRLALPAASAEFYIDLQKPARFPI